MSRVKRGVPKRKRVKNILKSAKGFHLGRKNLIKQAKNAVIQAGQKAYIGRILKKRTFRRLWTIRISGFAKRNNTSYSVMMGNLLKKNVLVNRKMLAELVANNPEIMTAILKFSQK